MAVGKPFAVNGTQMAYGYLSAAQPSPRLHRGNGGTCDECGARGATHHRRDSSGIPGVVCDRCNRSSQYELSFA